MTTLSAGHSGIHAADLHCYSDESNYFVTPGNLFQSN